MDRKSLSTPACMVSLRQPSRPFDWCLHLCSDKGALCEHRVAALSPEAEVEHGSRPRPSFSVRFIRRTNTTDDEGQARNRTLQEGNLDELALCDPQSRF